jgi:putative intracellular protease/amidase
MAHILFVLTSHTQLGETGRPTGFYFEELATPYYAFADQGHDVTIASIRGGPGLHDPSSLKADPSQRSKHVQRFVTDPVAMEKLAATLDITAAAQRRYDAVFLPGGHGVMFDFPKNPHLAALVGAVFNNGGTIGAVCHGPAGLVGAKRRDGRPIVEGLRINSFTDAEEAAVGLTEVMPFLLESRIRALGGVFEGAPNFTAKAVRDGQLITGQNPMSSALVAALMLDALSETSRAAA